MSLIINVSIHSINLNYVVSICNNFSEKNFEYDRNMFHVQHIGFYLLHYSVSTGPNPMRACHTHLNAVSDV